jgi:antitoxin HigA-1
MMQPKMYSVASFGMTPEFWINLQARYDLDVANRSVSRRIEQGVKPRAA